MGRPIDPDRPAVQRSITRTGLRERGQRIIIDAWPQLQRDLAQRYISFA
jgi:hypothetical protein